MSFGTINPSLDPTCTYYSVCAACWEQLGVGTCQSGLKTGQGSWNWKQIELRLFVGCGFGSVCVSKKTSANLKAKKAKKKLNHKTQKAVSTGSAILNNELNANLTDWIQYAITWNTNKT